MGDFVWFAHVPGLVASYHPGQGPGEGAHLIESSTQVRVAAMDCSSAFKAPFLPTSLSLNFCRL